MKNLNTFEKILFILHSVISIIVAKSGVYIIIVLLTYIFNDWLLLLIIPWIWLECYRDYNLKVKLYIKSWEIILKKQFKK